MRARLTHRGAALAWVAVPLAAFSAWMGQRDLLRIAIVLAALPALSWLWVRTRRPALDVRRTPLPPRLAVGDEGAVELRIRGRQRGTLVVADELPPELGRVSPIGIERLDPEATVRYAVRGGARGRWPLGPLRVEAVDPFGLAQASAVVPGSASLLVVPAVLPVNGGLPGPAPGGELRRHASVGLHGDLDLLPREHRTGDDMRRVHWPATARTGSLMVRREERSWRDVATVLVDTREGHASLEWTVQVAASLACALAGGGWTVRLVDAAGATLAEGSGPAGCDALLAALAVAGPAPRSALRLQALPGLAVAVLGRLDRADADALRATAPGHRCGVLTGHAEERARSACGWDLVRCPPGSASVPAPWAAAVRP